jgi:hypothetical protein
MKAYTLADLLKAHDRNIEAEAVLMRAYELCDYGVSLSRKKAAETRTSNTVGKIIRSIYGDSIEKQIEVRTALITGQPLPLVTE